MSSDQSITHWIAQLKKGDDVAAFELWQRYFARLTELAKRRLRDHPRRSCDEEDVVVSVFDSLCKGAAAGRFRELTDRDDLWKLLLVITRHKAVDLIRREKRKKRGEGQVRGESLFGSGLENDGALEAFMASEPTPEFMVMMEEQHARLLSGLRNDQLRMIANRKLEGYSNEEIASEMGVVERTIRRKIKLISDEWIAMSETTP